MASDIQVLIHEGELWQITQMIQRESGSSAGQVKGCLYGLWRTSLKQPVVQFVTGSSYGKKCHETLLDNHAMLLLGYWFARDMNENEINKIFHNTKCSVVLCVDVTGRDQLSGTFVVSKDGESSKGELCHEDVLPNDSSFRLCTQLTDKIPREAKIRGEIGKMRQLVNKLPSRAQPRVVDTKQDQWYSEDEGLELLQAMSEFLKQKGMHVDMSRDSETHNIQFTINDRYRIDFPSDFPSNQPTITEVGSNRQGPKFFNCQECAPGEIPQALYTAIRQYHRY